MPQYISKESFYEEYQNQIKNQIKNQSIPFYLQNGTDDNLCFHSSFPKSLKNVFENYIEKDMTSYDYNYDTTFMNIFLYHLIKRILLNTIMYVQSISNEINDEAKKHEKVKTKRKKVTFHLKNDIFLESLTIYNNENPILSACISGFYFEKTSKGIKPYRFYHVQR